MYLRFPLYLRNSVDLLHEYDDEIHHETVRILVEQVSPIVCHSVYFCLKSNGLEDLI